MERENVTFRVHRNSDTARDFSVKIACLLSLLLHVVLGTSLYYWQSLQKIPTPVETKILLKLVGKPLPQFQQEKSEIVQSPQTAIRHGANAPATQEYSRPPAEVTRTETTTVKMSTPVTSDEKQIAPTVRANAAESVAAFLARLEQRKEYPYMARKRGQTGTVTVRVRIAPDGGLREATIVASSGVAGLDEAAIELVGRSCPFRHETGEELRMTVPINYNLKD